MITEGFGAILAAAAARASGRLHAQRWPEGAIIVRFPAVALPILLRRRKPVRERSFCGLMPQIVVPALWWRKLISRMKAGDVLHHTGSLPIFQLPATCSCPCGDVVLATVNTRAGSRRLRLFLCRVHSAKARCSAIECLRLCF